jgi:hypothetical protein
MARVRKTSGRSPKNRILILCEGAETERNYFNGIKQFENEVLNSYSLEIKIPNTEKNTPLELVEEAIEISLEEKAKQNKFDEVWVVFDKDKHPKMNDAFQKAKSKNIKIAFSSICFEYWLLLHYKKTTKAYSSCAELMGDLSKHIPEYEKNIKDIYNYTKANIGTAIDNAENLRAQASTSHSGCLIYDVNPYVNIDDLIKKLLKKENSYSIPESMRL